MKKIILAFSMLTTLAFAQSSAIASDNDPVIAIMDTGINNALPVFQDRIIYEVCILESNSCLNNQSFMEGTNSALINPSIMENNGFDHGTQMASVLLKTNPDLKIVFIRVIGNTESGGRAITTEATLQNSLQWVIDNAERFNIQAVSMSQGQHVLKSGKSYCPKSTNTQNLIKQLKTMEIPVFFPSGNNGDYSRIDWPACIPESIAVSAMYSNKSVAYFTNYDKNLTDFFANGYVYAFNSRNEIVNAAGTSTATQVAAASWLKVKQLKPNLSYNEIYNLLRKTAIPVKSYNITGGKLINLKEAIK